MRTITFYTHYDDGLSRSYKHTKYCINYTDNDIHTTQLTFISFDGSNAYLAAVKNLI